MNEVINQILSDSDYENNPYFTNLRNGSFSKEDFIETQIQFYFAVVFFPRPMAAAAGKIPTHKARLEIMRNVWEEHGVGKEEEFHGSSFKLFLERVGGVNECDIIHRKLWPEVRSFNTLLIGACVMDEYIVGVAVLGMIELMFSHISSWIGQNVVENGWITKADLIHYNLHEELDIKHSQDFFDVLRPAWERSEEDRYLIEQGLSMGAYAFNRLYFDLYLSRERRALSEMEIHRHQRT
ncbi:TenA family transcriptional regulator [Hahella ganghwensis]|uniref:TenA family transcriptional regulator n=1 Tax=Hahella ganghwensis TaxID=286420 RepID=UPI0003737ADA|nr:iron-containing redox enzyme family protein [Hahella ganghwensis]